MSGVNSGVVGELKRLLGNSDQNSSEKFKWKNRRKREGERVIQEFDNEDC
jgi:hypothetical protein